MLRVSGVNMANIFDTLSYLEGQDDSDERIRQIETARTVSTQLKIDAGKRAEVGAEIRDTDQVIKRLNAMHTTAVAEMGVDVSKGGEWKITTGVGAENDAIQTVATDYQSAIDYEKEQYSDNPRVMQTLELMEAQANNLAPALIARNDYGDTLDNTYEELRKVKWTNTKNIISILDNFDTGVDAALQSNVVEPTDERAKLMRENMEGRLYVADVVDRFVNQPIKDEEGNPVVDETGKQETHNLLSDPQWIELNPNTYETVKNIQDLMNRDNEQTAYKLAANLGGQIKLDRAERTANATAIAAARAEIAEAAETKAIKADRAGIVSLSKAIKSHLAAPGKGNTVGIFEGSLAEMASIFDGTTEGAYDPGIHGAKMTSAYDALLNRIDEMEKDRTFTVFGSTADVFEEPPKGFSDAFKLDRDTKARILSGRVYWNDARDKLLWTVSDPKMYEKDSSHLVYKDYTSGKPVTVQGMLPSGMSIDPSLALEKTRLLDYGVSQFGAGGADEAGFRQKGLGETSEEEVRRSMQLASELYLASQEKGEIRRLENIKPVSGQKLRTDSVIDELDRMVSEIKENVNINDADIENIGKVMDMLGGNKTQALNTLLDNNTIGKGDWWILKDSYVGLTSVERGRLLSMANAHGHKFKKEEFFENFVEIINIIYGGGYEGGITL